MNYRSKHHKHPWYLLTNLSTLQKNLAVYRARWGIETMFKSCQTGGYNLEQNRVKYTRLLALVLVIDACLYSLYF
ncbi:transposase [Moorena producens]|uniref:transposase n=1 Tax=Moorena producens TaxID=1155739 RepID=UPI0011EA6431|nr:transposase [Moorena producens]